MYAETYRGSIGAAALRNSMQFSIYKGAISRREQISHRY
jgi:hypothetical protein